MFTKIIDKKIRKIAAYYGLTVVFSNRGKPYDPETRTIRFAKRSDALHDIAHYAIATDFERDFDNFGLGTDPDFRESSNELYPFVDCQKIEESASALGIFWEREIGMPYKRTLSLHNWHDMRNIDKQLTDHERTRNMDITAPLK